MSDNIVLNLKGLNTYSSHRITEDTYLLDCNNIVCDQQGVISTRRGFAFFDTALSACKKIFAAIGSIFVQANNTMYYDNAGTFTAVAFPTTTSYNANSSTQKTQIEDQNKSLYFNGKRVSSETSAPIDKKIKKLTAANSNVVNAGLEAPINLQIETYTAGSGFANNETFAIRVFYQYTDINNFLITSPVSERVVALNDTGAACSFILKFQIPVQYIDVPVNIYYAISNTFTSPVTPDDNLFWSEETVMFTGVNINVGLDSDYSFGNFLERDTLTNPVDLYTNAGQEGILQNNDPPLCSVDIETYSGFTFYGNLIDRLIKRLYALSFPLSTTILTLDGISYQRKATSDFAASPVEFSGDDVIDYTLDLCRAITATQTKYKAIMETYNPAIGTEWVELNDTPLSDTVNWIRACTDGTLVYLVIQAGGNPQTFYIYNPVQDTFRLPTQPTDSTYSCIEVTGGKVYLVGGVDSGATFITQIYDIATDAWTTGTTFPGTYSLGCCSNLYNGNIYLIGGTDVTGIGGTAAGVVSNAVYIYNIVGNSWSTGTNMTAPRYYGTMSRVDDDIYYFGGLSAATPAIAQSTVYKYDVSGNSWSTVAALGTATFYAASVTFGSLIYFLNGATGLVNAPVAVDTVYIYDTVGNTYSPMVSTNETRYYNAGVVIGQAIYDFSGYNAGGLLPTEKFTIDGLYFQLQERFIGEETDISYTSSYISNANFNGTSSPLFRFAQKNTIQFSKQGQPEAVPFLNNFQLGSATYDILRLSALRTSLMVLKTDGIYQLNGVSPETFSVQQLDPTFILIAAQSVAKLNNEIYCLTNKGIVAINESGAKIISYPIKDLIDYDVAQVGAANLNTAINATAYEDDYRYIITINDNSYTYNYVTDQWTIWFNGNSDIMSWVVFNSNLYYIDSTRAYRERKTLTNSDYQDENGAGIDAMIEFNNLEFIPGKVLSIIAMQILQREESGITLSIIAKSNFNTPAAFTKLLDSYVERVMFGNRMAFYFRPKLDWNTEIVATPGTFSNLELEGLDFEYEQGRSNIT